MHCPFRIVFLLGGLDEVRGVGHLRKAGPGFQCRYIEFLFRRLQERQVQREETDSEALLHEDVLRDVSADFHEAGAERQFADSAPGELAADDELLRNERVGAVVVE